MRTRHLLIPALVVASAAVVHADTQTFNLSRARIIFTSEAPLETINGRSSQASGSVQVDPANLAATTGTITVPVSSLRTGIELRDQHLRGDDWLDAGQHPNATFEIKSVSSASRLQANQDTNLQVNGKFTIHGVTRDVRARVRIKWDGSRRLQGRAQFTVRLDQHGVEIPSIVQAKVSNEIKVRIDFRASR